MARRSPALTRRALLGGAGACGLALIEPARAANVCADAEDVALDAPRAGRPLGTLHPRVSWGVAMQAPGLYDPQLVEAVAAERPQVIAIGSGLKFDHLYPRPPTPGERLARIAQWREADDVASLARRLGASLRGDCLAWNDWPPAWLAEMAKGADPTWRGRARDFYAQHFEAVFAHFADAPLSVCGLVNEPFEPWHPEGGRPGWRKGPWLDAFGFEPDGVPGYIHAALALAERYAPARTRLLINESNCDNDRFGPLVRPALLDLIDKLRRTGRRLDAIGLECHLMPQWMADPKRPDWRPFVSFLDELGRRGLDVHLTEIDVNDCSARDARERDALVADTMGSFVAAALRSPAVVSVTNWDLSDKYSWLREGAVHAALPRWAGCVSRPPCPRPTPFDQAMRPKRARDALAEALRGR